MAIHPLLPSTAIEGVAAGVPFIAVPPGSVGDVGDAPADVPVVVTWHLLDPPRTPRAFAAALPLQELPAWRIHLCLPLSGPRMPPGGGEEINRLGFEDAVMNLHGPIAFDAAAEFPAVWAALRTRFGFGDTTALGLLGGSNGSAVAELVLLDTPTHGLPIDAAVLVSPVTQLRPVVDSVARRYGFSYPWSEPSSVVADRLDFVRRADEFVIAAHQPALRLIVGADDDVDGFIAPARRLRDALATRYDDAERIDLVTVAGVGHALADEPGDEPAPQTPGAAAVERHAADWFQRHLIVRPR